MAKIEIASSDKTKSKEKKAWHVTTATHNSRYLQRMFDYHVKLGESVWISVKDEIIIAKQGDMSPCRSRRRRKKV